MGDGSPTSQENCSSLLTLCNLSNVSMDPGLFAIIFDLLKKGVSPDALYAFLVMAMHHSKLGKKLLKTRTKSKAETDKRMKLTESNQEPDQV